MRIIFSPRYNISLIPYDIPDLIVNEYKFIINSLSSTQISFHYEKMLDKEDWLENILQLIYYFKYNSNIILYSKEIIINETDIIIGIITRNLKNYKFPLTELQSNNVSKYFEYDFFNKYSNRKTLDIASTFYRDSLNYYKDQLKKYPEKTHFKSLLEEAYYCQKNSIEKKLSLISRNITKPTKFFIKTIHKDWSWIIELQPNQSEKDIYLMFLNKFEYQWIERINNVKDCILIQEFAEIYYEYRFIIINNKIITGAACIEEFTPLNNKELKFDIQLRRDRLKVSEIEENKLIVLKYLNFAEKIVKKIDFNHYTLDVAFINGEVGIIEVNPYLNVGYYASNLKLIMKEISTIH